MEKKQSSQKVKSFLKRNVYYIIMAVCLLAIAAMVTVTVVLNDEEESASDNLNNTLVEEKDDSKVSGGSDKQDVTPISDTPTGNDDTKTSTDETKTSTETDNSQTTGKEQETIGEKSEKETPVVEPIVFIAPVETVDIIKDYSMDSLVWNSTLRHYAVHNGIDFGGEDGTKVLCVCDGVITSVEYDILNGYSVTVQHNDTLSTCYGSLNEPTVKVGQTIKKGDTIGTMGTTAGNEYSMGPHLHFSVIENKKYTDPYQYMTIGGK